MKDVIDCIQTILPMVYLGIAWCCAAGLVWIHDIVKERNRKEDEP